ncbi:uncharacterized protein LOC122643246 [Telopea speciosissima]|uniref:uncharacterized protein LOC122643246 n=1 Tax=Telopea speciosissima TaxID=54955 RepID=UPI001CC655F0|nr:uncharacterized protein LOC122643246 [Telopea speciosissima]
MIPKSRLLPLFLLSLFSLFLYSYYHSSLHLFAPETVDSIVNPTNSPSSYSNHPGNPILVPPNFTFIIKVLAFDRFDSLSRCLRSLANADYGHDKVHLHVFIDHFKEVDLRNGSEVLSKKLEESSRILDFVDGFSWRFGEKFVHYRTGNVGLQAQWLEAWWPSSDDEFAFVVEDDLEVSPLYYEFLKALISNYYYNSSNFSPSIYGASLQRPRFVAGKHGNKLQLGSGTRLFLYQLVGTWGQLLFPKPWKEFRLWYDEHKAKNIKPVLEGMVTTGWYKKMGERIWTPWFIKFIHSRSYFNIYTNFLRERALSVSHRDAGVNYGKTAGPDSYLLDESSLDFNLLEMLPLSNLKWYDFCFREVIPERAVRSFDELNPLLKSVQKDNTIILLSTFGASQTVMRNMLCLFERLDVRNYILLGPESDFLLDLARRGHPVVNVQQLLNGVGGYKLMGSQGSNAKLIREILSVGFVIKKCLDSHYSSWVIVGNMVPISVDAFSIANEPSYDFFSARDSGLLFVRSSAAASNIWIDDFIYRVAEAAKASMEDNSLSSEHRHFVYFASESLQTNGVRIKKINELSFGVKIFSNYTSHTSLGDDKKIIFWPYGRELDYLQKALQSSGMWVVDGDSSCVAVVCHHS